MEQFKLKEEVEPKEQVQLKEEVRPNKKIDELEKKKIDKDFVEKYKFSQEELDEFEERFESLGRKEYAKKHKRSELDVRKLEMELKKRGKKEFRERLKWTEKKTWKGNIILSKEPNDDWKHWFNRYVGSYKFVIHCAFFLCVPLSLWLWWSFNLIYGMWLQDMHFVFNDILMVITII